MAAPIKFVSYINNYTCEKMKELKMLLISEFSWSYKNHGVCRIQSKQR